MGRTAGPPCFHWLRSQPLAHAGQPATGEAAVEVKELGPARAHSLRVAFLVALEFGSASALEDSNASVHVERVSKCELCQADVHHPHMPGASCLQAELCHSGESGHRTLTQSGLPHTLLGVKRAPHACLQSVQATAPWARLLCLSPAQHCTYMFPVNSHRNRNCPLRGWNHTPGADTRATSAHWASLGCFSLAEHWGVGGWGGGE